MKKILVVLFCLLMIAGCTGGNENIEKKDLSSANTLKDFDGTKLAGQKGTIHGDLAQQINYANFIEYSTVPDELIALKSGAVDGFICEEPQAIKLTENDDSIIYIKLVNNSNGFKTTVEQSGLAIGCKKGSELTENINQVLADAKFDSSKQSALMQEMVKVSLGQKVDLTVLDYDYIDSAEKVLKVGMECDSDPYNWTDVETTVKNYPITNNDGYYANGYDVQVSAYIASKLGMKLEVYAYEWESLIPAVEAGAIDAIIAGMSPTKERAEKIDFTNVYYDTNFVIVVNK